MCVRGSILLIVGFDPQADFLACPKNVLDVDPRSIDHIDLNYVLILTTHLA
jgi:hypothetical protein